MRTWRGCGRGRGGSANEGEDRQRADDPEARGDQQGLVKAGEFPEVAYAAAVTGAFKLLACAVCRDEEEFYDFLTTRVGSLRAVDRVETSPIIRTLKQSSTVLGVGGASLSPRHAHRRPGAGTPAYREHFQGYPLTTLPIGTGAPAGAPPASQQTHTDKPQHGSADPDPSPAPAPTSGPHPRRPRRHHAMHRQPISGGFPSHPYPEKNPADPRPACRAVTG